MKNKSKKLIKLKDFRAIPPYKIFLRGFTHDGEGLKWLAKKLPNQSWAVFVGQPEENDEEVLRRHTWVSKDTIPHIIKCSKQVLDRYDDTGRGGENK